MATPRKLFTIELPIDYAGAPIGKVTLNCIVYLYYDGTLKTLDINEALFNGKDIADYVSAAQPGVWDEWIGAAEDHYKAENEIQTPEEMAEYRLTELDNNAGTGTPSAREVRS